jgi:hypothetical protein
MDSLLKHRISNGIHSKIYKYIGKIYIENNKR